MFIVIKMIGIILGSLVFFAHAKSLTNQDLLITVQIKPGIYQTQAAEGTPTEHCENEEVEVAIHESDGSLALALGNRFTLGFLNQEKVKSPSAQGCQQTILTKFETKSLQQEVKEICDGKIRFQKKHRLLVNTKGFDYHFSEGKKNWICHYLWVSGGAAK